MRQKVTPRFIIIAALAACCIALYAAALIFAAVRISGSLQQRKIQVADEFTDIADLASSAAVLGFMQEPFIETIEHAIFASVTVQGVIISGPGGQYAFERRQGSVVDWINDSPRFKKIFGLSQSSLQHLRIEGQRNVTMQVTSALIDYEFVVSVLKRTLIIVLAALVISFLILLFDSLARKQAAEANLRKYAGKGGKTVDDKALKNTSSNVKASAGENDGDIDFDDLASSIENDTAEKGLPLDDDTLPDFSSGDNAAPDHINANTVNDAAKGPEGLYSPKAGIGWEDYTAERLTAELHRCASFEQDMLLIMMEFRSQIDDKFFKLFADEAVEFFQLRDLIFEKGDRGISVIYPNMDIDQGFAKSDEFHNRIFSKYPESFSAKNDLCIGLSSRSGRLIDAERLVFETTEALGRALADPDAHIVAFRSDPEKYRKFIAAQSKTYP